MDSIKINIKHGMKAVMPGVRVMELANSSKQVLQALTNRESVPEEVNCNEELKGATGPQEGYHSTTSRY